jgi:hypothetical protein
VRDLCKQPYCFVAVVVTGRLANTKLGTEQIAKVTLETFTTLQLTKKCYNFMTKNLRNRTETLRFRIATSYYGFFSFLVFVFVNLH